MVAFSFYSQQAKLPELEKLAASLQINNIELDEDFLHEDTQALLRARYVSGLRYISLRMNNLSYTRKALQQAALWCEANNVASMLFIEPSDPEQIMRELDIFRVKVVFENKNGTFLSSPDDLDSFFRANRNALLSFNAAEMVSQRIHPFLSALNGKTYRRQLFLIRVQDRCFNGADALPCAGDAELAECFSAVAGYGLDCWASIAPYAKYTYTEIKSHMCEALCRI